MKKRPQPIAEKARGGGGERHRVQNILCKKEGGAGGTLAVPLPARPVLGALYPRGRYSEEPARFESRGDAAGI